MNRRLSANPLDSARSLRTPPVHGRVEKVSVQNLTAPWIERVGLGNAKYASQVAAGEIEKVRGYELQLLAIFDTVPKHPRRRVGFTWPALSRQAINLTTMLAQEAAVVVQPSPLNRFVRTPGPLCHGEQPRKEVDWAFNCSKPIAQHLLKLLPASARVNQL